MDYVLALAAVLHAAAELIPPGRLASLGAGRSEDVVLLALSEAFAQAEAGLMADLFEWGLLLGIAGRNPLMLEVVNDALRLAGSQLEISHVVLASEEGHRMVTFSPGGGGHTATPPQSPQLEVEIAKVSSRRRTRELLLGNEQQQWVRAALRTAPAELSSALSAAATSANPPLIGITAGRAPSVRRDPETGVPVAVIPSNHYLMAMGRVVMEEALRAMRRRLSAPPTPLSGGFTPTAELLHRWRYRTVGEVVAHLHAQAEGRDGYVVADARCTGASDLGAGAGLIAFDATLTKSPWAYAEADIEDFTSSLVISLDKLKPNSFDGD